jgi:hypothetical protein
LPHHFQLRTALPDHHGRTTHRERGKTETEREEVGRREKKWGRDAGKREREKRDNRESRKITYESTACVDEVAILCASEDTCQIQAPEFNVRKAKD